MNTSNSFASAPHRASTRMNILVSHSNALISAGLVATMQRYPGCEVKTGADHATGFKGPASREVDLLIADSAALVGSGTYEGAYDTRRPSARLQIVLMTATSGSSQGTGPLPPGISACLPMDCGQDDLVNTVYSLFGAMRPLLPMSNDGAATSDAKPADRTPPRGGLAPSALRKVRDYIENHLGQHIVLEQLAAMVGLSTCHFSRAFKQSLAMPPHRYVMSRRIIKAARMIETTDMSISDIALEVGFADQSHFTRVFSAQMRESPRRFRHLRR